jgi:hypothetical protein
MADTQDRLLNWKPAVSLRRVLTWDEPVRVASMLGALVILPILLTGTFVGGLVEYRRDQLSTACPATVVEIQRRFPHFPIVRFHWQGTSKVEKLNSHGDVSHLRIGGKLSVRYDGKADPYPDEFLERYGILCTCSILSVFVTAMLVGGMILGRRQNPNGPNFLTQAAEMNRRIVEELD